MFCYGERFYSSGLHSQYPKHQHWVIAQHERKKKGMSPRPKFDCLLISMCLRQVYGDDSPSQQTVSGVRPLPTPFTPLCLPADVVKSRMQSAGASGGGMFSTASAMWKTEGFAPFYRGLSPTIMRAMVNHAATFLVYEAAMSLMRKDWHRFGKAGAAEVDTEEAGEG